MKLHRLMYGAATVTCIASMVLACSDEDETNTPASIVGQDAAAPKGVSGDAAATPDATSDATPDAAAAGFAARAWLRPGRNDAHRERDQSLRARLRERRLPLRVRRDDR